jgi:hypothetical protein
MPCRTEAWFAHASNRVGAPSSGLTSGRRWSGAVAIPHGPHKFGCAFSVRRHGRRQGLEQGLVDPLARRSGGGRRSVTYHPGPICYLSIRADLSPGILLDMAEPGAGSKTASSTVAAKPSRFARPPLIPRRMRSIRPCHAPHDIFSRKGRRGRLRLSNWLTRASRGAAYGDSASLIAWRRLCARRIRTQERPRCGRRLRRSPEERRSLTSNPSRAPLRHANNEGMHSRAAKARMRSGTGGGLCRSACAGWRRWLEKCYPSSRSKLLPIYLG